MKIVSGLRVKLFFFKLNLKLVLFLIQKYGFGKQFKDKKAEIERFKEQLLKGSNKTPGGAGTHTETDTRAHESHRRTS